MSAKTNRNNHTYCTLYISTYLIYSTIYCASLTEQYAKFHKFALLLPEYKQRPEIEHNIFLYDLEHNKCNSEPQDKKNIIKSYFSLDELIS